MFNFSSLPVVLGASVDIMFAIESRFEVQTLVKEVEFLCDIFRSIVIIPRVFFLWKDNNCCAYCRSPDGAETFINPFHFMHE